MSKIIRYFLIILIAINVLYVFSGVMNFPMQSMDVFSDWLLKPKVLFLADGFPLQFFQNWNYLASHMQYPLLLPMLFSLIYKLFGGIHEVVVLSLYPFIYLTVLAAAYKTVRRYTTQHMALLLTYVYSMLSPLLAQGGRVHAGNADIFLTLIGWIMLLLLHNNAMRVGKKLFLLSVCVVIASQIKLEGLFLLSLLLFFPASLRKKLPYLFASALPAVAWIVIVRILHFANDIYYAVPTATIFIERVWIVLTGTIHEMLNIKNWYLFWPLAGLAIFLPVKQTSLMKKTILPAFGLMFAGYACSYLFSFFSQGYVMNTAQYLASSMDRILLQLSPFFFLYAAEITIKAFHLESKEQKTISK